MSKDQADYRRLAMAFRQMYGAATEINEVLGENARLNDTVPKEWPLPVSADEFAATCEAMFWHYEELSLRRTAREPSREA